MITSVTNDKCHEYWGKQADFDRIKDDAEWNRTVGNGSRFIIIPTLDLYIYDEEAKKWELSD